MIFVLNVLRTMAKSNLIFIVEHKLDRIILVRMLIAAKIGNISTKTKSLRKLKLYSFLKQLQSLKAIKIAMEISIQIVYLFSYQLIFLLHISCFTGPTGPINTANGCTWVPVNKTITQCVVEL